VVAAVQQIVQQPQQAAAQMGKESGSDGLEVPATQPLVAAAAQQSAVECTGMGVEAATAQPVAADAEQQPSQKVQSSGKGLEASMLEGHNAVLQQAEDSAKLFHQKAAAAAPRKMALSHWEQEEILYSSAVVMMTSLGGICLLLSCPFQRVSLCIIALCTAQALHYVLHMQYCSSAVFYIPCTTLARFRLGSHSSRVVTESWKYVHSHIPIHAALY
jgi:hypothetical protein